MRRVKRKSLFDGICLCGCVMSILLLDCRTLRHPTWVKVFVVKHENTTRERSQARFSAAMVLRNLTTYRWEWGRQTAWVCSFKPWIAQTRTSSLWCRILLLSRFNASSNLTHHRLNDDLFDTRAWLRGIERMLIYNSRGLNISNKDSTSSLWYRILLLPRFNGSSNLMYHPFEWWHLTWES